MLLCIVCGTEPLTKRSSVDSCRCGRFLLLLTQYVLWDGPVHQGRSSMRLYDAEAPGWLSVTRRGGLASSRDFQENSPAKDSAVASFLEHVLLACVLES